MMKLERFNQIIEQNAFDAQLRWKRSGLGGGIVGFIVSGAIIFSDDRIHLIWMAMAIVGGILVGLFTEWISPWASGRRDAERFAEIANAIWQTGLQEFHNHQALSCWVYILDGTIETQSEQLRVFFSGIEQLQWVLISDKQSTRVYYRQRFCLRVTLAQMQLHVQLSLTLLDKR